MQPHFPRDGASGASSLPPIPSKKPKVKIERKQPGLDNNGFDSNSENTRKMSLGVKPTEEKQYKKVVRRQPRPEIVDDKAAANIDARQKALQNRIKRADPNQSNDELEIEPASDKEPHQGYVHAMPLASNFNKNKPAPPTVVPKKQKATKTNNRKSIQDEDMYDLPEYDRTDSEIEAAKREGQSTDEEDYSEEDDDNRKRPATKVSMRHSPIQAEGNLLVIIAIALALVAIVLGSTGIGLAVRDGSGKKQDFVFEIDLGIDNF